MNRSRTLTQPVAALAAVAFLFPALALAGCGGDDDGADGGGGDGRLQKAIASAPGKNRLAFGVIDNQNHFIYGKSAVYLARGPSERAFDSLTRFDEYRRTVLFGHGDPWAGGVRRALEVVRDGRESS
jgi:hypothetical protein